jgi:quinol-cytochrome oxidoreductase complex cytochrome b subunit
MQSLNLRQIILIGLFAMNALVFFFLYYIIYPDKVKNNSRESVFVIIGSIVMVVLMILGMLFFPGRQ